MTEREVDIYALGPLSLSCCAPSDMSVDEVTAAVNRQVLAGTENGWQLSSDATFRQGGPMPGPCNRHTDRTHYLFEV